ncbi:MAG: helix-turn-helix domain-containing protein, partial [Cetobacterium sp.]
MKTLNKGYKFRIYPTEEQKEKIEKNLNASRYIWNQ